MANASDQSPYILAAPDSSLPNSRTLAASDGLAVQDTGASESYTIATVGNLNTLSNYSSVGFLTYDATLVGFTSRSLNTGTGISISAPAGQEANPTISVIEESTVQKVNVLVNGLQTTIARSNLNFIPAGSVSITSGEDSENINITITGSTNFSPKDATYIIQTPDINLPSAQPLSILSTGLMKVTTGTGVVTTAVADTDYQSPSTKLTSISNMTLAKGVIPVGNDTNGFTAAGIIPGAINTVLSSNGPGEIPSYKPLPSGSVVIIPNGSPAEDLASGTTYISNNSSLQTFNIPLSATAGEFYTIIGFGAGGWKIPVALGQTVTIGDATPVTSGQDIASILKTDSITIYAVSSSDFVGIPLSGQTLP